MTTTLTKRARVIVLALVVVALVAVLGRGWWLPWPARWLDVNDTLQPADAIVVLSGNSLWRAKGAARLFAQHYAPRIIVMGGDPNEMFELLTGEHVYDAELTGRVLNRLGVPRDALVLVNGMKSTHDEANALQDYVRQHPTRVLILVTSHLHSRRARWTVRRAVAGTAVRVLAVDVDQPDVSAADWWQHPDAALGLLNEYLKFGYYRLHY